MENAMTAVFHPVETRGIEGLFSDCRIDRKTVPKELYLYEVRSDETGTEASEISEWIVVDFFGALITEKPITRWDAEDDARNYVYIKFSGDPEYFENDNGITEDASAGIPHYCPLESEWNVDSSREITVSEWLHDRQQKSGKEL